MKKKDRNSVKRLAKRTLEKYSVAALTPESLKNILSAEGYMVIRYSAVSMSEQTERLMQVLGVEELARNADSFTYADRERRIVFVRADVSEEEFVELLALELGRIYCVSNRVSVIVRGTPDEEFDAAEFAYHLIDIKRRGLIYNFFKFYAPAAALISLLAMGTLFSCVFAFLIVPALRLRQMDVSAGTAVSADSVLSGTIKAQDAVNAFAADELSSPARSADGDTPGSETSQGSAGLSQPPQNASVLPQNTSDGANGTNAKNPQGPQNTQVAQEAKTPSDESVSHDSDNSNTGDGFVIPVEERVYYATANGKKYHLAGCSYLKGKDIIEIHQADIDSGKYEPCSRCFKK